MKWAIAATIVVLAIAGVAGVIFTQTGNSRNGIEHPPAGAYRGSEPPGINLLPKFTLPSYEDGTVRSGGLRGRVVLTTFVDTACTESCPIIVAILGRALPQLTRSERGRVTALAISVNPHSDTRAHIRHFLAVRGALGTLDYLVAPVSTMHPVWRRFHILSAVETGNADVHSSDVRIYDRHGVWVSDLNAGADLTVANLLHDIREALRS